MIFTLQQAMNLVEFFGGDDVFEVAVEYLEGHPGPGLYAYLVEYTDEGSYYLGPTTAEAAVEAPDYSRQASQIDAVPSSKVRAIVSDEESAAPGGSPR